MQSMKTKSEAASLLIDTTHPFRLIPWLLELDSGNKEGEFQKKTTSASLTAFKPLTVCITGNWEIHQEMGIPDHLSCLLSNLYAG